MYRPVIRSMLAIGAAASCVALPAHAQLAVIDIPAIVQLIQEVQAMQQQVQTAQSQLAQAKQTLQAMSGPRGMEQLLSGTQRNYLPVSGPQLLSVMQGTGAGYPTLATAVRNAQATNAVLTMQSVALLSVADQKTLIAARQSVATQQAVAQAALVNASARFASLQNLIAAIPAAADQKGILDLQARIVAELGMLQNEQTKLLVLHQALQAQDAVDRQQMQETTIAEHGRFESRFQPTP